MLFIDSSHQRQPTIDEWHAWRPRLAPGALVVFHDHDHDDFPGVAQAVEHLGLTGRGYDGMFVWQAPGERAGPEPRASAVDRLRTRLRLRQRLRPSAEVKGDEELAWWLREWDPVLAQGGFLPDDVLTFLPGEEPAPSYEGRRWQQARAEVRRVLHEARIADPAFFDNKVVVDIGPGALGFPDACPARFSIGVDPLAQRFADAGLLLASDAIYLVARAEATPLLSGTADVVLMRNSLDHVDDPQDAVAEARRLLRPGGTLILNFDVDHTPTATEPHALDAAEVRSWLDPMEILHEEEWAHPHGHDGHAVVVVARQRR